MVRRLLLLYISITCATYITFTASAAHKKTTSVRCATCQSNCIDGKNHLCTMTAQQFVAAYNNTNLKHKNQSSCSRNMRTTSALEHQEPLEQHVQEMYKQLDDATQKLGDASAYILNRLFSEERYPQFFETIHLEEVPVEEVPTSSKYKAPLLFIHDGTEKLIVDIFYVLTYEKADTSSEKFLGHVKGFTLPFEKPVVVPADDVYYDKEHKAFYSTNYHDKLSKIIELLIRYRSLEPQHSPKT